MSVPIYAPKGQDLSIVHVVYEGKIYDARVVQVFFSGSTPEILAEINYGRGTFTTIYRFDAIANAWR